MRSKIPSLRKRGLLERGRRLIRSSVPDLVERDGEAFFQTGRLVVKTLQNFIQTVRDRDLSSLRWYYSSDFAGCCLGLDRLTLDSVKDGIHCYRFFSSEDACDRGGAVMEWRSYLAGFAETEEIGLHLHRLEAWEPHRPVVTTVRFEHIGKLSGEKSSSIDRAYFRIVWERVGN